MKSESKIICKYFIAGNCLKGEKCHYLHSKFEIEQDNIPERECPMYSIGFCKNGSMCKFIHIKKDEHGNDINQKNINPIISDDDTSSTPFDGDSVTISYHEENEKKEEQKINVEEESIKNKPIPIWYLEHYYDKPISAIFSDLEKQNLPEVIELQKKYDYNMKDNHINMNLNFNNFDMNFAFNNYYSFNLPTNNKMKMNPKSPLYLNNNYNNFFFNQNQYMAQIDYIEYLINNFTTFYNLVKFENYKCIKHCIKTNLIHLPYALHKKYRYLKYMAYNFIVVLIIYNCEDEEFFGFAKLQYPQKKEVKENKKIFLKYRIKWLWKNGIKYSEVSHLVNKADHNHFLCEGNNWCPIHSDLGNYMCRLMLQRLSEEEVLELMNEKKIFKQQMNFQYHKKEKIFKDEESYEEDKDDDTYKIDKKIKHKKIYYEDSESQSDKIQYKVRQKRKRDYKNY